MKITDYAKATGFALGLLITNILIVIVAVTIYATVIAPGESDEFYNAAADRIAPICTRTVGLFLFFSAAYLTTTRRPDRNGLQFSFAFTLIYVLIDAAMVGLSVAMNSEFLLAMFANVLAAGAGVYAAKIFENRPSECAKVEQGDSK